MVTVPPEFTMLFLIPIFGTFFIYDKTADISISLLFYISTQMGIATLAHYMYS